VKLWGIRLLIFGVLILGTEGVGRILYKTKEEPCENCHPRERHESLKNWHPANKSFKASKQCPTESCFSGVEYQFDDVGRRTTSNFINNGKRPIALLGDSFIFGYGLKDEDTPAGLLQEKYDGPVYNYGFNGAGTFFLYNLMRKRFLVETLPEETDMVIFLNEVMLFRDLPSTSTSFNPWIPYCRREEERLHCGDYKDFFPYEIQFIEAYEWHRHHSDLIKYLDPYFSLHSKRENALAALENLREFKKLYEAYFKGKLIILIHPHKPLRPVYKEVFDKSDLNIQYLPEMDYDNPRNNLCSCDFHPSSYSNKIMMDNFWAFYQRQ
jgi:hypothetical protein